MNKLPWLLMAGLVTLSCASELPSKEPSAEEANKMLVRAFLQRIVNDSEWSALPELFPESVSFNGQEMSMDDMRAMAGVFRSILPDLHVNVAEQIADGDIVATRVRFSGTHEGDYMGLKASGKQVTFSGLTYDRIRDGKIVEMWHEMNIWGTLLMASDD